MAQLVKNPPAMGETWFQSWVGKIPWRREWLPTPIFWPGEFHGQRSLAGYSPWDRKESDMNEQLSLHFTSLRLYDHMILILSFCNVLHHIDLHILNYICIPRINPTWPRCLILFIYYWIWFVRIFTSIFNRDIGLYFLFFVCVISLPGFGIRVMVTL